MSWALGVETGGAHRVVRFLDRVGGQRIGEISELVKEGLPTTPKRMRIVFEGSFADWEEVPADEYLKAFGITLGQSSRNLHQVFSCMVDGLRVFVPSLALIRTFFKPAGHLLPHAFSPSNVDAVSFVDYTLETPVVVVNTVALGSGFGRIIFGSRQEAGIRWLQSSKSARVSAQSVHLHALNGALALELPKGVARVILHGLLKRDTLFATHSALVSIVVNGEDSISGLEEEFIFHGMADERRTPTASIAHMPLPNVCEDGHFGTSPAEWRVVEPMLQARRSGRQIIHSQRELLDAILFKLASGKSWKSIPRGEFSITDLTSTFRRWTTSGRLGKVLAFLDTTRPLQ